MIINVHAHIRKNEDVQQRVNYFRAPGMDKVCLSGDNALVMKAHKTDEDFVVPIAEAPIEKTTPEDMAAFKKSGFKGVRFENPPAPYADERFFPLYEKLEELSLPLFLRTGHSRGVSKCHTEYMKPIYLDSVARFFPDLYIVGSQLGNPWFFEAIAAMM